MEIIGYILVVLIILYVLYFLLKRERPIQIREVSLLGFILLASICLALSPRLAELEIFKIARLKLREVTSDANTIRDMRRTIEKTSEEVNAIKQEASNRLDTIEQAQRQAKENVTKLIATSNFTVILSRAEGDDRTALSELLNIARDSNNAFSLVATQSLRAIENNVSSANMMVPSITWPAGHSLQDYPYSKLRQFYITVPETHRPTLLQEVWEATHYTLPEKLDFLIEVIQNTRSIKELQKACQLVNQEAKLSANLLTASFLETSTYLEWWHRNRNSYLSTKQSSG